MGSPPYREGRGGVRGLRLARVLLVAVVLLVASPAAAMGPGIPPAEGPSPAAVLVPHGPIYIGSNAGFNASNGVVSGQGTATDPYVIAGWALDAPGQFGIQIKNTDAYVVLRDLFVDSALEDGFYFFNVLHVSLYNVTAYGNLAAGLRVESSQLLTLDGSNVAFNGMGAVFLDSTNLAVTRTNFTQNQGDAIRITNSPYVTIEANNISLNGFLDGHGVDLASSTYDTVSANNFTGNGVFLDGPAAVNFDSHTITADNVVGGLPILYQRGCSGLQLGNLSLGQLILASCRSASVADVDLAAMAFGVSVEVAYGTAVTLGPGIVVPAAVTGIRVDTATGLRIVNNEVLDTGTGIELADISGGQVTGNKISSPSFLVGPGEGVHIVNSRHVTLAGNTVRHHRNAIQADASSNVTVTGNVLAVNVAGVGAYQSRDLLVSGNLVASDGSGIRFLNVTNATIASNEIESSWTDGANISASSQVRAYGNSFVSNHPNAVDDNAASDAWNAAYPTGGNYWSDYVGVDSCTGPAQTDCSGPDGLGDTPYTFAVGAMDRYPLMTPRVNLNVPPEALFLVSPYNGNVRTIFSVDASPSSDFEDPASAIQVRWDWEGLGAWATPWSAVKNATHVYTVPGVHTIVLEVRDSAGLTDTWSARVYVAPKPDALPPSIEVEPPATVEVGRSIPVVATIADASGLSNATLLYRGVRDTAFQAVAMGFVANHTYEAMIPAQPAAGTVVFVVLANDSWGNQARAPVSGYTQVLVIDTTTPVLVTYAVVGSATVVLAVAAAVFVLRRKRPPPKPQEGTKPPGGTSPPGNP